RRRAPVVRGRAIGVVVRRVRRAQAGERSDRQVRSGGSVSAAVSPIVSRRVMMPANTDDRSTTTASRVSVTIFYALMVALAVWLFFVIRSMGERLSAPAAAAPVATNFNVGQSI